MSQFKKIYLLRQNTPIWHFQHNQGNATLRATEVKPKLDRFLLVNTKVDIKPEWFIKQEDSKSLDYKLHIYTGVMPEKPKEKDLPQFFGNTGVGKLPEELAVSKKKALFFKGEIFFEIFSMYPDLIKYIGERLEEFFFVYNFGTRQSKGYGSFSFIGEFGSSNTYCSSLKVSNSHNAFKEQEGVHVKILSSFKVESKDYIDVLNAIDLFYKSIRGGILGKMDSVLSKWISMNHKLEWDKKVLAKLFKPKNGQMPDIKVNPERDFLYRDYMGLAVDMRPWNGQMSKEHKDIRRFKSPVFIKPVVEDKGYRVYIGCNNTANKLKGEKFNVTFKKGRKITKEIQMYPSFDLQKYLEYCIVNGESFVRNNCNNYKVKKDLIDIYEQLKNNKTVNGK